MRRRSSSAASGRSWPRSDAGELALTVADEDVHTGVERRLREIVGPVAGKLHTGRSRNDQVANDLRLWTKGALLAVMGGVLDLADALTETAAANADLVMPGYTHLQRAQPVLLAHHLLAYVAMLRRDLDRLQDAYRRTDVMPLGAGALAGVTYPIDRGSDPDRSRLRRQLRQQSRRGLRPRLRDRRPLRLCHDRACIFPGWPKRSSSGPRRSSAFWSSPTPSPPAARSCRRRRTRTSPSWRAARPAASTAT